MKSIETPEALRRAFVQRYGGAEEGVRVFAAPGRVNLIGEHVDYCGGPVLPAALGVGTFLAARVRGDDRIRVAATDLPDTVDVRYGELASCKALKWGSYPLGVASELLRDGHALRGCDLLYHDTVPHGAGLSSSAAIDVATACALLALSGAGGCDTPEDRIYLAQIGQRAENRFVGVSCGIMDPFASAMGRRGHAILLHCDTLEYAYIPLVLGEYRLILMNTNKKRALADSKYNERRAETVRALTALQAVLPEKTCLADVTPEELFRHRAALPDEAAAMRALHVTEECARVHRAAQRLREGDLPAFGALLNASHDSLRDLYAVTGVELDTLVDAARNQPGVLGARMTGAGFGGCAVALVHRDAAEDMTRAVHAAYTRKIGYPPTFYPAEIGDGVREVEGRAAL